MPVAVPRSALEWAASAGFPTWRRPRLWRLLLKRGGPKASCGLVQAHNELPLQHGSGQRETLPLRKRFGQVLWAAAPMQRSDGDSADVVRQVDRNGGLNPP
jgi:hypothetical protein